MASSLARALSVSANLVALACAVGVTYAVLERFVLHTQPTQAPQEIVLQADWEALFAGGQRTGPVGAPLGMVVFSDYECPACLALHQRLQSYEENGMLPFGVLYRHWPLEIHRFAERASVAAECAG